MNIHNVIEFSFMPHDTSKRITREMLEGREYATFESLFDGTWRKVWASLEHGILVAGIGQLSGNTCRIMQEIARNEAIDIADARSRSEPMPTPADEHPSASSALPVGSCDTVSHGRTGTRWATPSPHHHGKTNGNDYGYQENQET